jgi:hypothetical protein
MEPTEDLGALERRLGQMQPTSGTLSRERMLFLAGSAAANNQRRTHWAWPTATASLSVTVLALGIMLVSDRRGVPAIAVAPRAEEKAPGALLPSTLTAPEFVSAFPTNAGLHSYLALRNEVMERENDGVKSNAGNSPRDANVKERIPLRAFDRSLPDDPSKET